MTGGTLAGKGVPMGGRRRRSRRSRRPSRRSMRGGELYTFGGGPYDVGGADPSQLSGGNVRVPGLGAGQTVVPLNVGDKNKPMLFSGGQDGGRRRKGSRKASRKGSRKASRKSGKSGKMSPWLQHVMAVKAKNPSFSLGDAMKAAKETYKK